MATATAALVRSHPRRSTPQVITVRTRAPAKPKHKHHSRRHAAISPIMIAVAGYVLGQLDKGTFGTLPTIPMLGRAGTIAVGAWYFGKGNKYAKLAAIAASAIAGYEYGSTGKVVGSNVPKQL